MKKLLSLLLALSLSVSLLGGSVLAADGAEEAPFELAATLDQENKTVTLSLRTTRQLTFGSMDFELTWPNGFSFKDYEYGSDYSDFNVLPTINAGKAAFVSLNFAQNGSTVDGGKEFLTYTLDATAAAANDYTFSITFNAAADAEANPLPWQGATVTSNEITITEEAEPEPVVATIDFGSMGYMSSNNKYLPYGQYHQYQNTEMIYDKNRIATSGTITALAFYVASALESGSATESIQIYMGTTDRSGFTSSYSTVLESQVIAPEDLTLVYEGNPTLGQNEGWETLELTESFYYNNSQNLVIFVYGVSSNPNNTLRYGVYPLNSEELSEGTRAVYCKLNSADISDTYYWIRNTGIPYLQLTFASDACTHANVATTSVNNEDGTHTVTKRCNDCGAVFSEVTETHTFDWASATFDEEDQIYTALCTDCDAQDTRNAAGKTLLQVTPATTLVPGKVYVITDPDGSYYAMSVDPAPRDGGGTINVRDAVPVTVVQDQYAIFDNESDASACQWEYLEGGYLKSHSKNLYLYYYNDTPPDLWTRGYVDADEEDQYQWTYTDGLLLSMNQKYVNPAIVFNSTRYDGGGTGVYGTGPYFDVMSIGNRGDFYVLNLYEVVGAHAHIWDDVSVTTEPTCTEPGVRTYNCTVEGCTETKTETIAATGHTWDEGVVTQEPTCGEDGVKTYTCTACGETKTEVIPATGEHTWGVGVVTTAPTLTEEGVMTYICTVCGETKTEPIPVLEPPLEDNELGVTIEVHTDYMGGYSLIVVYGESKCYFYGENAMYRTTHYDRDTQDDPNTAFAYIAMGAVTAEEARKLLSEADTAAAEITAAYDVNASGTVDISDVQAVADCYNIRGDLAKYMPVYLRADVNADYVVNSQDAKLVLGKRS